MITLTLRGDQIGEALQFDPSGLSTSVEIGRVWFGAGDTVTLTLAPSALDPVTGAVVGGAGSILGMTVASADGRVTTFAQPTNPLDVDPDQSKQGADFFYISESPAPGSGGAYAGVQLEKIVISTSPLIAGTTVAYGNTGGFTGVPTVQPPPPVTLTGTAADDTLTGNDQANTLSGRDGNDTMFGREGNDRMGGDNGNDRMDGGLGNDSLRGGQGNDLLLGDKGADRLLGEAGDDLLNGGAGRDVLSGGAGGDIFVFGAGDRVTDFNAAEGDQIAFAEQLGLGLADIRVIHGATGATLQFGSQSLRLDGVTQPFDLGNAITFDYQGGFDFL